MAQFVYLITAMLGLMTLLMTSQRGTERVNQTQMINEVSTQLTNAASETLETIGRSYFDQYVLTNANVKANRCGRVADGQEALFATEGSFTACTDFDSCADVVSGIPQGYIEGFHDLNAGTIQSGNPDATLVRGGHGNEKGFSVNIEVAVRYVEPDDYSVAPGSETFAKEVSVTAHTPDAYLGDDPNDFNSQFSLTLTRVFTYGCPTHPNQIPQPAANQSCADVGLPVCAYDNGS